jgi:hypothetical protein
MLCPISTAFLIELNPYEEFQLDFADHGIPDDAMIVSVNYTSQGPAKPECAMLVAYERRPWNEVPDEWRGFGKRSITPVAIGRGPPEQTKVAVGIHWFRKEGGPVDLIRNAYRQFIRLESEQAILLASTAIESELAEYLSPSLGVDTVRLMPLDLLFRAYKTVSANQGLVEFPHHLVSPIGLVKKLRNDVAHSGRFKSSVTRKQMAEMLVASAFFLQHLRDAYNSTIRWHLADGTVVELGGRVFGASDLARELYSDAVVSAGTNPRVHSHYGFDPGSERLDLDVPYLIDAWVRYYADKYGVAIIDAPTVAYPT